MPSAADIIKDSVSEFSRLQKWMISVKDKDPDTYNSMHDRYIELKVTLSRSEERRVGKECGS